MRRISIAVLAFALVPVACAEKSEVAAKKEAAKTQAAKPEQAPKPPPAPPSEFDALRKNIEGFAALAVSCDKGWFAKVDPSKIDKWELAIDVPSMEERCDPLLTQFQELVQPAGFRHPALDEFLRGAALVADRYMFLGFRCKKVGVRDKIPYKKMLGELRDALRADVGAMSASLERVRKLSDADLRDSGTVPVAGRIQWSHDAIARLPADFTTWIESLRKENLPIWRYSLMTSATIGTRAAGAMGAPTLAVDGAAVKAAGELATGFADAWKFWSGDYFEAEEKGSPLHYKVMKKVSDAWKKASAKAFPKAAK